MSLHFDTALSAWRECRAEYDLELYAAYERAAEELIEHWREHPRVTFERFERVWMARREAEMYG